MANRDNLSTLLTWLRFKNTANPFSGIFGRSPLWSPKLLVDLFKNNNDKDLTKAMRAANLTTKILAAIATAGTGMFALRGLMHLTEPSTFNMASKDPTKQAVKYYDKPAQSLILASNKITKKALLLTDSYNFMKGVLPPAAFLLATIGAYNMSDEFFDRRHQANLLKLIAQKLQQLNEINTRRVMKNRGVYKTASELVYNPDTGKYVPSWALGALGLLAMVLLAGGGWLGFLYQRSKDPNIAKLKAVKAGALTWAKQRALLNPIESRPMSMASIQAFNKNVGNKPRLQTDLADTQLYKQVDIV